MSEKRPGRCLRRFNFLMFIHMVLFKIKPSDVRTYVADCRLWAREAGKWGGLLKYHTLFRTDEKGHCASFYLWKNKRDHDSFMKKHHDRLVALSRCPVKVLGYFNFKTS